VVHPGETIAVNVSASGGQFLGILIIGEDPIGFTTEKGPPPYKVAVKIPVKIRPGRYLLSAQSIDQSTREPIFSKSIAIDVERPDWPKSLTTDAGPYPFELRIGAQIPIQVLGTYSDGSVVDLSRSRLTKYVSRDPAVVTVTDEGNTTGVAPGTTSIEIRHGNHEIVIPVVVTRIPR